jgi:ABC-type phosphate transport system substrate-binding protein
MMRARFRLFCGVVCSAVIIALAIRASAASAEADRRPRFIQVPAYVVIVHPSNPHTVLSLKFVTDAFLKKTTRWPNGQGIRPVDLPADSEARIKFSEVVLRRSVAAVKSYWQQIIFSGRDVPPPELATESDVVRYVATNAGAVGYVSGAKTLVGVKAVSLE